MTTSMWLLVALYLTPVLIALARRHHCVGSIMVLNLALGWTGLGWVLGLAWALGHVKENSDARAERRMRVPDRDSSRRGRLSRHRRSFE